MVSGKRMYCTGNKTEIRHTEISEKVYCVKHATECVRTKCLNFAKIPQNYQHFVYTVCWFDIEYVKIHKNKHKLQY